MKITRETDYAVRCLVYLAFCPEKICFLEEISKSMDVPKSFLAKILQKLSKKGMVKSFRGVKGGYMLSRQPHSINLLEIIEAMQGKIYINKCVVDNSVCSRQSQCSVHNVWKSISDFLNEKISAFTLDTLLPQTSSLQSKSEVSLKPISKNNRRDRHERLSV